MKYMLLMHSNPAESEAMTASDLDKIMRKHEALRAELTETGELRSGAGVEYPESTKTLRWGAGETTTSDGPLKESELNMSAYYVIDCESLERALRVAERMLDFHVTAVEVREVHDSVGMEGPPGSEGRRET